MDEPKQKGKFFPHEQYTLLFKHEYIDSDGIPHRLSEPIVVRSMFVDDTNVAFVLNNMLEKMMRAVLEREGR